MKTYTMGFCELEEYVQILVAMEAIVAMEAMTAVDAIIALTVMATV